MKKLVSAILMAVMLFSFAACANVSKDTIQPAVYRMEDELYPRITLRDDGTFSFILNTFASQSYKGTYSVSDKVLKLECTDGSVFCFDIERKAIVFNSEAECMKGIAADKVKPGSIWAWTSTHR